MFNVSPEAIAITKRFFIALDVLIGQRKLKSLNSFAKKYNINYWNLCTLRNEPERRVLKIEYITCLIKDYNISPWYILFGTGNIFSQTTTDIL
ncbi:hypothetical protein SAMN05216383_1205 [Prevotella sp. KH2C16]|nr:hypothetical protein SAMN05216383_1205 [Prevotella sp. KH2C16]